MPGGANFAKISHFDADFVFFYEHPQKKIFGTHLGKNSQIRPSKAVQNETDNRKNC